MPGSMECTVFISDTAGPNAFEEMNGAYSNFFGAIKPTRAAFFVKLIGEPPNPNPSPNPNPDPNSDPNLKPNANAKP